MKKILFVAIALSSCLKTYAQIDFREGFYLVNSNDTVSGLINYEENIANQKRFQFKSQKGDEIKTFYPLDVAGYGFVGDKFYESGNIEGEPSKVFLEVLVSGLVSLYKYDGRFFVRKENDPSYHELVSDEKLVERNGRTYETPAKAHIGTLKVVMADCRELSDDIHSIKLIEKELTKLVKKYNNCVGASQREFKTRKPWFEVSLEPGVGMVTSRLDKTFWDGNGRRKIFTKGAYHDSFRPFGGLTLDFSSPRVIESITFQLGLFYFQSQYLSLQESRRKTEIELKEVKIPFSIRYTYRMQKISPYLTLGGALSTFLSDTENTIDSRTFVTAPNQFGAWGGIGARAKLFKNITGFAEVRYERTNTLVGSENPTSDIQINLHHFYTLIGIKF